MPPAAKKDVLVIIFDLKSSNKDQLLEGFLKIATSKMLMGKDLCHVLLTNSSKTSNAKDVPNIVATKIQTFDPQELLDCINKTSCSEEDVNFYDTLLLGIYYIKHAIEMPGVVNLQIVYFTDLVHQEVDDDTAMLDRIIKSLNEKKLYLSIVGPDVQIPDCNITQPGDVPIYMRKILGDESNKAFVTAREIVKKTERSVLCNLKIGLNMIMFFRKSQGSQAWSVPLSIGSLMDIPAKTSKIYNDKTNLKLRSKAKHMYSKSYVLKDDTNFIVAADDLVRGVLFHSKFIKIDSEDMFKFETLRSFDLVGFTSSKFVSEGYMGHEGTFHVLPGGQYELFQTLVSVLAKQDKYAIVQRIYNKNNNPKFFVLKPDSKSTPCRFIMTDFPYADDILGKYLRISNPKPVDIKSEENDFNSFCQSLDIHHDRCCIDIPVAPTMMLEYFTNNVVKETAKKLCHKEMDFKETELFDFDCPLQNEYCEALKQSWSAVQ